ncbi:hypothetical protein MW7_003570 [Imbroritus primus]|uniref:Uncharacterized protein n=1 Tax=Imbroritus primus TaxID=3058603 RepID=A0ACD3SSU3_9BURK|nr:hypothetical protein MW7_003570 [Burkholderiaceae bacterium PBA]
MKAIGWICAVVFPMVLGACGGGGDGAVGTSSTQTASGAVAAVPPATQAQVKPDVLAPAQWHMACRNGFEYPATLPQYPAWLRTYGYRVTLSIDRQLSADEAEATVTYSAVDGAHCDATPATVLGEVIRTYRLRRVGEAQVAGRTAAQVEATLLNERRTGAANPAPGDVCMTTFVMPHRVPACQLADLPVLQKTILALSDEGLLAGFHVRGMRPTSGEVATYESATGFESDFDPVAFYRQVGR